MAGNTLLWPMMDGTYLEVIGCLEAALVDLLLGGVTDLKIVDGFGDWITSVLVNVNGWGGGGGGGRGAERTDGLKQVFPRDVNT